MQPASAAVRWLVLPSYDVSEASFNAQRSFEGRRRAMCWAMTLFSSEFATESLIHRCLARLGLSAVERCVDRSARARRSAVSLTLLNLDDTQ